MALKKVINSGKTIVLKFDTDQPICMSTRVMNPSFGEIMDEYDKEDDKKQRSTENRLFKKYACRDWDGRGSTQWKSFPTQSPICRGNDGLPFNVDNLTIPYGKWRKESIKAYGNAIVPLIAVKIFEMINKIEGYEQQTTL